MIDWSRVHKITGKQCEFHAVDLMDVAGLRAVFNKVIFTSSLYMYNFVLNRRILALMDY